MVGLVLLVLVPEVILGALGAMVSTVMLTAAEAGEVLPAASLAVAVMECVALLRFAPGVKVQLPVLSAGVVPMMLAPSPLPSKTVTVLLASAVPLMVGLLLLVMVPLAGLLMLGALGTTVSMVRLRTAEAAEVLPAASLALAVMKCAPSLRAAPGAKLQPPELSAGVV